MTSNPNDEDDVMGVKHHLVSYVSCYLRGGDIEDFLKMERKLNYISFFDKPFKFIFIYISCYKITNSTGAITKLRCLGKYIFLFNFQTIHKFKSRSIH